MLLIIYLFIYSINHVIADNLTRNYLDLHDMSPSDRALSGVCGMIHEANPEFTDPITLSHIMVFRDDGSFLGFGLALNTHWFLTTASITMTIEQAQNEYRAYQKYITNSQFNTDRYMRIAEITRHPEYTGLTDVKHNIAVVKVCPQFIPFGVVSLPNPTVDYVLNRRVWLWLWVRSVGGPLQYFCNYLTTDLDCIGIWPRNYDSKYHFCVYDKNHTGASIKPSQAAIAPFVSMVNQRVGFIIYADRWYQVGLKFDNFITWIYANIPIPTW